jgi:hypothetical protein
MISRKIFHPPVLHRTLHAHRQGPRCVSRQPLRRSLAALACGVSFCRARGGARALFFVVLPVPHGFTRSPSAPPPSAIISRSYRQGKFVRSARRACLLPLCLGCPHGACGAVRFRCLLQGLFARGRPGRVSFRCARTSWRAHTRGVRVTFFSQSDLVLPLFAADVRRKEGC